MAGSLGSIVARLPAQQRARVAQRELQRRSSVRSADAPLSEDPQNGGWLVRSPTPGAPFFFIGHVRDRTNQPIVGAEVDVWHSLTSGLYESQDSEQADMNLRGKFTTDETGTFSFTSIKPAGYPIPTNGNVVGQLLDAQGRHPFRPAHVHFLMVKPGFKVLISQVFMPDDEHLQDDVQFGVTRNLIGNLVRHDEPRSDHPDLEPPWYWLDTHSRWKKAQPGCRRRRSDSSQLVSCQLLLLS